MSFEVFLTRYVNGEEEELDAEHVRSLIRPLVVDQNDVFWSLRAGDGTETEVYISEDGSCSFTDPSGGGTDNFMIGVARELGCVLQPAYGPIMIFHEAQRSHLPDRFAERAVVIQSTADFGQVLSMEWYDEDE
ncbi:hypothetical protein FH608_006185 [Nonomuraea phyllanthi]|uniref:Uncharacterized protein n=1 Tax=Nonomuraea phyllanthi TaxID=2219224 RepID=A0A5C4WRV0_9ACTN|nr:hypothetical protein [Nonomuraea phyllanthi]KAB8196346.1 hypothetical protein FH608_006185 [Nonomuraea phyllanthi]